MNRQPHRERGIATIEMAAVVTLTIVILAMIVLSGRLTWHAIALTKGVANTNRIVATLPRATIVGGSTALKLFTINTVYDATRSAGLDIQPDEELFDVNCGLFNCTDIGFSSITVSAAILFHDTIFGSVYQQVLPENLTIPAAATQTYATTTPKVLDNK
ncbi:hypothetical protein [Pseudoduganella albidiflava]|uniref:Pilus assembly protein n=1 Tax=Pseudoduganella albidiflava TaxID=321983 RepID=A0A411X5J1_9BURK|nr:hypothetical protein [Pseudoduganella albidiflava]QBI04162.1 hypothetical protein EYF70_27595 [Pseudoduganella albidiflava]GGY25152.1 hypothetical protein GCM10007387_03460 [Pseudoduganella albidiflava]